MQNMICSKAIRLKDGCVREASVSNSFSSDLVYQGQSLWGLWLGISATVHQMREDSLCNMTGQGGRSFGRGAALSRIPFPVWKSKNRTARTRAKLRAFLTCLSRLGRSANKESPEGMRSSMWLPGLSSGRSAPINIPETTRGHLTQEPRRQFPDHPLHLREKPGRKQNIRESWDIGNCIQAERPRIGVGRMQRNDRL